MNLFKLNQKLYSDIMSSKYPEAYFINQENDINVPNTHNKKGWKYFVDGYRICKNDKNYSGHYYYDRGAAYDFKSKPLDFVSFSDKSGINFLDFINSIINGNEKIFVQVKGLDAFDLRKSLFETQKISIRDTNVDNLLVSSLSKYFSKLKEVNFINCKIKKECNFDKLKSQVIMTDSVVEDIRVFNDCKADLNLLRTSVSKISNTTINSSQIEIKSSTKIDFKNMFLKCNFPNLETLIIDPEVSYKNFSYEDSFIYLPTSAPNLENLSIMGKVNSLEFITNIKNLLRCDIKAIYDIHSSFYPDITNTKEKQKFEKRNAKEYQIEKILHPDAEDKFILGVLELNRIIKLAHFNKLLSYSDEQKKALLSNLDLVTYIMKNDMPTGEVKKFYESYFDRLYFRNTENDKEVKLGFEDTYGMINNFLYSYRNYKKNEIVNGKNYIYNYDGVPIIFLKKNKPIRTVEQAEEFRAKYGYAKGWDESDLEKYDYNIFLGFLEEIKNSNEDITVGNILDGSSETTSYRVKGTEFLSMGDSGKQVAGIFEKYYRLERRTKELMKKNDYYRDLIEIIVDENYELFTLEEKQYIYVHNEDNYFYNSLRRSSLKANKIDANINDNVVDSINYKTKGLYKKYIDMLKLTYEQSNMLENPYDLEVDKKLIKTLKIK